MKLRITSFLIYCLSFFIQNAVSVESGIAQAVSVESGIAQIDDNLVTFSSSQTPDILPFQNDLPCQGILQSSLSVLTSSECATEIKKQMDFGSSIKLLNKQLQQIGSVKAEGPGGDVTELLAVTLEGSLQRIFPGITEISNFHSHYNKVQAHFIQQSDEIRNVNIVTLDLTATPDMQGYELSTSTDLPPGTPVFYKQKIVCMADGNGFCFLILGHNSEDLPHLRFRRSGDLPTVASMTTNATTSAPTRNTTRMMEANNTGQLNSGATTLIVPRFELLGITLVLCWSKTISAID